MQGLLFQSMIFGSHDLFVMLNFDIVKVCQVKVEPNFIWSFKCKKEREEILIWNGIFHVSLGVVYDGIFICLWMYIYFTGHWLFNKNVHFKYTLFP